MQKSLVLLIYLAAGILVAYWTALLPPVLTSISPGATGVSYYGFPAPWKEDLVLYCAPFHPQACPNPVYSTTYDWFGFAIDVLFYMVAASGLVFLVRKYLRGKPSNEPGTAC